MNLTHNRFGMLIYYALRITCFYCRKKWKKQNCSVLIGKFIISNNLNLSDFNLKSFTVAWTVHRAQAVYRCWNDWRRKAEPLCARFINRVHWSLKCLINCMQSPKVIVYSKDQLKTSFHLWAIRDCHVQAIIIRPIFVSEIKLFIPELLQHFHNWFFTLIVAVMEIAVGEYEVDFTRMMAAAIKKYYEDRDKYDLEQLQATTESILRSSRNENCDKNDVTVYEFANSNNNDGVTIKKFKEIREVKESTSKFRMEKHTETASLLMQFFVLFDRNFKASSRNRVCIHCTNTVLFF